MKQGYLYKRGNLLKMYSTNQYMFYLERKEHPSMKNGPYLKYGRKGKAISNVIDLGNSGGHGGVDGEVVVEV